MKKKFSTYWISSKQKRKQTKYRHNMPLHLRNNMMSANLNKELRTKYSRRNFPVRKNDKVKVMVGKFRGKEGKVSNVDLRRLRITIEGLQIQKKDGTKVNVYFNPSNVQIQELFLDDKQRILALEKQGKQSVSNTGKNKIQTKENKGEKKENASEKK